MAIYNTKASKKSGVFIQARHLVAGAVRKNYADNDVKGFTLRTTPNGVFTFYYQYLNRKTGKRDWHLIGTHPAWSIADARNEARDLATKVQREGVDLRAERNKRFEQQRTTGVTFQQVHDEYIAYCKQPIQRPWGMAARKESWPNIARAFKRPLARWGKRAVRSITDDDIMKLYESWISTGNVAQANEVRTKLSTLFKWAAQPPRKYIVVSPCHNLPPREATQSADDDVRVLSGNELRTFWYGVDDPDCPGDRLSKLALKLSLVTGLRTGEIVRMNRDSIGDDMLTIPRAHTKMRRLKQARAIAQPLNSLAREILGEVFAIGDPNRKLAFPSQRDPNVPMKQLSLSGMLSRTTANAGRMGIVEFLGMERWTPHCLRHTTATILNQLGYDEVAVGRVLAHKQVGKDASPVTRAHYIGIAPIIERPVDPRVVMLDELDKALRTILQLKPVTKTIRKLNAA